MDEKRSIKILKVFPEIGTSLPAVKTKVQNEPRNAPISKLNIKRRYKSRRRNKNMTLGSIPSIVNPDIQHKNINTSCEDLKDNSNETDSILLAGRYQKNAKVQRSTLAKFFSKRKVRNLNSLIDKIIE